jgi:hypothetical protein
MQPLRFAKKVDHPFDKKAGIPSAKADMLTDNFRQASGRALHAAAG